MTDSLIMILAWIIASGIYLSPIAIIVIIIRTIKKKKERKEHEDQIGYKVGIKPLTFPDKEPKSYPSGWTFNEETKLWDPPAHMKRKEPTYEEWREAQLKKENESAPKNQMTGEGTYRYDYIHIPSEEIKHYHHTDTNITIKQEAKEGPHKPGPKENTLTQKEIDLLNMYRAMTASDTQEPEKPKCQESVKSTTQEPNKPLKQKKGYEDAYEARQILSYNERRNYKTLLEAANRKGYSVQMKMHLADIIGPKTGDYHEKYYTANFRRISQHHVDFAILNDRLRVVAVIELDDNSHDRTDRKERDEKIDSILEGTNIKIIHTRHITPDILDNL